MHSYPRCHQGSPRRITGLKNGWIHDFKWCCQLIPASFCVGFIFSPLALSLNPPRVQWKKEEFSCPSSLSIFLHEAHSVKFESMDSLTRLASSIIYYSYNLISPLQALAFFHLYHNSSGPITSQQIDTEKVETVTNFIFLGSKITVDNDCSHEIKRRFILGRKALTNLDSILKSRDINWLTKVYIFKAISFPVVMYRCDSWTIK